MVGEPGVGKTAIAEGIARKIFEKKVPKFIQDHQVYTLDISALLAGSVSIAVILKNALKQCLKLH
jgi:ATP-dependent Clp protease ATP-binding subunit ClpA